MQSKHEAYIRAINITGRPLNILTFPTHEAYETGLCKTGHNFFAIRAKGVKDWNTKYRPVPDNYTLLDGSDDQIKPDMAFDLVLSQNKFGQFEIAKGIADSLNIPLISLEHTLPFPGWTTDDMQRISTMRGDINVFISEHSVGQWGYSLSDKSVKIVHHGIDIDVFKPIGDGHNDGKVLTVVNDWINRDWCCNFSSYKRICLDTGMPTNPVGDTPGFSKPADGIKGLVSKYQNASVFFNTSVISPVPTALMEAMACGCPVVTTSTCMIPSIVKDGVNGFISNDESYLREKLIWCLEHPEEAKKIGEAARQTIVDRFSLESHVSRWNEVLKSAVGIVHR